MLLELISPSKVVIAVRRQYSIKIPVRMVNSDLDHFGPRMGNQIQFPFTLEVSSAPRLRC
jgi:hypothetical protein